MYVDIWIFVHIGEMLKKQQNPKWLILVTFRIWGRKDKELFFTYAVELVIVSRY